MHDGLCYISDILLELMFSNSELSILHYAGKAILYVH